LEISGKELKGVLSLQGFKNLKLLSCHDNQLTKIDLSDCPKLLRVDCKNNKLSKLSFHPDANLKTLRASDNEFTSTEEIFSKIEGKEKNKYSASTLTYLNISNNRIGNGKISDFKKFINLKKLYLGNTDNKKGENKFTGSLKDLKELTNLRNINISNTKIKIKEFLGDTQVSDNLRIYYSFSELDELIEEGNKLIEKIKTTEKTKKEENVKNLNELIKKIEEIEKEYSDIKFSDSKKKQIEDLEREFFKIKGNKGGEGGEKKFKEIIKKQLENKTTIKEQIDGASDFEQVNKIKEGAKEEPIIDYDEDNKFIKKIKADLGEQKLLRENKIESIVKIPDLSEVKYKEKTKFHGEEDYCKSGKLIYPTQEAGFS